MTPWEFLTSLYFWIPATGCLLAYKFARRDEKKMESKLNHPAAAWRQHDQHFQNKFGVNMQKFGRR